MTATKSDLKVPKFNDSQCLLIENENQYNAARHMLRNPDMEWTGYPIYFEYAKSVTRGISVGIIFDPVNTWTKRPYEVVRFSEVKNEIQNL